MRKIFWIIGILLAGFIVVSVISAIPRITTPGVQPQHGPQIHNTVVER
jgi:hypothetical protein